MKTPITAVLACLFLSTGGMSAELVVTAKKEDDGFITYLHRLDKKGFKSRSPDNSDKEQLKGKLVWKDLEPGIYRIVIDPMEENFDSHWIGIQTIKVTEGRNEVDLEVPKGHVVFSFSFDGIAVPKRLSEKSIFLIFNLY